MVITQSQVMNHHLTFAPSILSMGSRSQLRPSAVTQAQRRGEVLG